MPQVSRAKREAARRAKAANAKAAGALLGDFSAADGASYLREVLRQEGARLSDSAEGLSATQRGLVIARMSKVLGELGQLTGETLVIDEPRFLRSPQGRRLVETIARALKPFPKAGLAVAEALEVFQ